MCEDCHGEGEVLTEDGLHGTVLDCQSCGGTGKAVAEDGDVWRAVDVARHLRGMASDPSWPRAVQRAFDYAAGTFYKPTRR